MDYETAKEYLESSGYEIFVDDLEYLIGFKKSGAGAETVIELCAWSDDSTKIISIYKDELEELLKLVG